MILSIKNLSHSFGDLKVFSDFSFNWPDDTIRRMGVLGPNGSGKSTLFKLISGEFPPKGGEIVFEDEDITDLKAFERNRKGIARTFQMPSPFKSMTVFENVYVSTLEHIEKSLRSEKVESLLLLFKLNHKSHEKAESLNLMELRLLEMARAFATNPKLILLDECMVGFTDEEADAFIQLLKNIQDSSTVRIMMIEHNVSVMQKFCDYMIVLNLGSLVAQGSVDDCFKNQIVQDIYFPMGR